MSDEGTKEKLLVIVGPTAVGKSKVAVFLAQKINGEIVSADSMHVYKSMDIGTAKPSFKNQTKVKHHLIDIVDPPNDFSVAKYQKLARSKIADLTGQGVLPILVGGSGLYIRSVIDELDFPKGAMRSSKRKELEEVFQVEGEKALHNKLEELDPKAAESIHPNNTRRVIRALEVIAESGEPFSGFRTKWEERESIYDAEIIGLTMPRALLYANINKRVDRMMKNGLVEEVEDLTKQGFGEAITSKQALGYKELLDFLGGRISKEQAVTKIKARTRQLAKRQFTWFRADSRIKWINVSNESVSGIGKKIVNYLKEKRFLS